MFVCLFVRYIYGKSELAFVPINFSARTERCQGKAKKCIYIFIDIDISMVGQKETKNQISSDHRKEIKDKIQSLGFMVKSSANYVFSASCMPTTN